MERRTLLTGGLAIGAGVAGLMPRTRARAQTVVGATATEIKIGNTTAYSGPAASYGAVQKFASAYFKMINDQGGINGRRINFISYDDGYSAPNTLVQTRRLVEVDQVACLYNSLGTATNSAVEPYLNQHKVPQLFVGSGADKWGNYRQFPWTIGFQPSYRMEARIYTRYLMQQNRNAKLGILYQNDDFGKDYTAGVRDVLGDMWDKVVVKEVSYEVSPSTTIDSQVDSIKAAGADALVTAATPKFAAMTIKKLASQNYEPMHFITNVSVSITSVLGPAGLENSIGLITADYRKDQSDPTWKDDAGMNEWRAFMGKYMPNADIKNNNYIVGFACCQPMIQTLRQCGDDLSRENIIRQAANLHDLDCKVLLPGITANSSPTDYHPIKAMQLQKWDGKSWVRFGTVIEGG